MSRLSYQIPNFTYPDTRPEEIFDKVVAQAKAAEAAGFERVMVMDHFYQLPMLGAPDEPMFECYTMLSALAHARIVDGRCAVATGSRRCTRRTGTFVAICPRRVLPAATAIIVANTHCSRTPGMSRCAVEHSTRPSTFSGWRRHRSCATGPPSE